MNLYGLAEHSYGCYVESVGVDHVGCMARGSRAVVCFATIDCATASYASKLTVSSMSIFV